jgi:hypothetical protein
MLEGVRRLAADTSKPAREADLAGTLRNVRELTRIAEQEIHAAVLSCTRARRSMLEDADREAYSALIFPGHPLPTSHILNRIERTALHGAGN